ncbi:MAG: hypothetical protein M1383_01365 [Patescibacteria group bacterium]|nr:hypothetical protein [Patescibacteria group bacterium]
MWEVKVEWVCNAPNYPNLGWLDFNRCIEVEVRWGGVGVVLGAASSGVFYRQSGDRSGCFDYNGKDFFNSEMQALKQRLTEDLVKMALAAAKENLRSLKAAEETEKYRIVRE